MEKRSLVEFITAILLMLFSGVILILPIFSVMNIKLIFILLMSFYGIMHFIKGILTIKSKDFSGFFVAFNSIVVLIVMLFLDINDSPWNLALLVFIWIILMSLTKLKESDYYHDRKNKLWKLNIFNLVIFIIVGILTTMNLYYTSDVQILVLGFFFLINGILELMDPLVAYIMKKN